MKTNILMIIASIIFLYGCEDNEIANLELSPRGREIFGSWAEVEPPGLMQLEGSTFTYLNLSEDFDFQLTYTTWTDMLIPGDPCNNVSDYHAKGSYIITTDSIFFNGCFSDNRHTTCVARCDRAINYKEGYEYKLTADSLILNPRLDPVIRRVMLRR